MNVQSSDMGRKDILKIENRELAPNEVDQIALIAPKIITSAIIHVWFLQREIIYFVISTPQFTAIITQQFCFENTYNYSIIRKENWK